MTEIEVDGENARSGLMALLVTVLELLLEAMEREAVRRMESGRLTDESVERLGTQLARMEEELAQIKRDEGIEEDVEQLRGDLDGVVKDAIRAFDVDRQPLTDADTDGDGDRQRRSPPQSTEDQP